VPDVRVYCGGAHLRFKVYCLMFNVVSFDDINVTGRD
jgi:hypothetical protein